MAHPGGEQADPAHAAAVLAAARSAQSACGSVVVVSIDGRSGAGKSVLAAAVGSALGCPVVHVDDLCPGWDGLADAVTLLTEQVLEPLSQGRPAAYRRWDWMRDRAGRAVSVEPTAHLVVEGCGALVPPAEAYAAVRVWVQAPEALRKVRALARDGAVYVPNWDRWAAQEESLYAARCPRDHADLVLSVGPT
ncbi:MAG: hypothetical protein ABIU87_00730 [Ornithinibacter sp.]